MEIIEYKRTCNKCGNVWYVPKEYLKRLKSGQTIGGVTAIFSDFGQGIRNSQAAESEIMRLKMCSKCNSIDFQEALEKSESKYISDDPRAINKQGKTSRSTIIISLVIVTLTIILLMLFTQPK